MSQIDNIALFNQLTHDQDGLVDSITCNTLLEEFIHFILLKNIVPKDLKPKHFAKANIVRKGQLEFTIDFPSAKSFKAFCKCTEQSIMYKGRQYFVHKKTDDLKVTLTFEKG